jgi:Protein of unknown function (DUF3592)
MKQPHRFEQSQRDWIAPEGLHRARPRRVTLTSGGKTLLVLALALCIGGLPAALLLGSIARRNAEERRLMKEQGVETEGRITRLARAGGEDRYRVSYGFTANGRSYERNRKVSARTWKSLNVGASLTVRYLPSNPEIHNPAGWNNEGMPFWVSPLAGCSLAMGGWLCMLPIRSQRRLLGGGRVTSGVVTRHSKGKHGYTFAYEFSLMNGVRRTGETGPRKDPPALGSTLPVLYDPEEPRKNTVYPLSLVRLAQS